MLKDSTIRKEMGMAAAACTEGNVGKARVCARRAVGRACTILSEQGKAPRRPHALAYLEFIAGNDTIPDAVREATDRLRRHKAIWGEVGISQDPISDANIILEYLSSPVCLFPTN